MDITNGGVGVLATSCTAPCAGLGFIGGWGQDAPAVVFAQQFSAGDAGNPQEIAEIASHEVGHTLGLGHDQSSTSSSLWSALMTPVYQAAPIMQWTSTAPGTFPGADELAIIEQTLTPKDDRYGQSAADATPVAGTTFDFSGTISASTQTDWFSFTVPNGAGPLNLEVAPSQYTSMLDLDATLFDSSLNVVEDSNPPATFVTLCRSHRARRPVLGPLPSAGNVFPARARVRRHRLHQLRIARYLHGQRWVHRGCAVRAGVVFLHRQRAMHPCARWFFRGRPRCDVRRPVLAGVVQR